MQLAIQELRRQHPRAVGDLEGQGLPEEEAPRFQRNAFGEWHQTQVLRCARSVVLCCRTYYRHHQNARGADADCHSIPFHGLFAFHMETSSRS